MNRRDFFRRSTPIAAASVLAPVSLLAEYRKPNVRRDANGHLTVDGEYVSLHGARVENGMTINAKGSVTVMSCYIESKNAEAIRVNPEPDTAEAKIAGALE